MIHNHGTRREGCGREEMREKKGEKEGEGGGERNRPRLGITQIF